MPWLTLDKQKNASKLFGKGPKTDETAEVLNLATAPLVSCEYSEQAVIAYAYHGLALQLSGQ